MSRPIVLVLVGIASVQFGAAVAKGLFDRVDPTAIAWLRLLTSVLVLGLVVRPRVRGRTREEWLIVLGYGVSLGTMNWAIYQSFARIPLGLAVTIEFVGPLLLAVAGSRRPRDLAWVGLAGLGVALLGAGDGAVTPAGVGFALLAGAAWAAYIVLAGHTGRRWSGLDGLVLASGVATVLLTPGVLLAHDAGSRPAGLAERPDVLLAAAAVGLLSSVVPYSCELVALRTLRASAFGILMSLEPAAAALAGLALLGELLSVTEWAAIGCVVVASVGATRGGGSQAADPATATAERSRKDDEGFTQSSHDPDDVVPLGP